MRPSGDDHLLGIDFGGTKMALALADANGVVIEQRRMATHAEDGAESALARALDAAEKLVADAPGPVVAAGVATPGVVRADGIDLAPNVPGWGDLRLADALTDRIGPVPVSVWNDVNAAALAEVRRGLLRDVDPGLVLGLGTGAAAALTVAGQVVQGAQGAAGEIGYAPTGSGPLEPGELALEGVFSGRALDQEAAARGLTGGAAELVAQSAGQIRADLDRRIDLLARPLIAMCLLLDPARIVVFGGLTRSELIVQRLRKGLREQLPFPPELVVSEFAQDAALVGAVVLAAEAAEQQLR